MNKAVNDGAPPGVQAAASDTALHGAMFLRRMQESFDAARERRPDITRTCRSRFAGRPVRLRVAGVQLAEQIFRPFAHLATDGGAGDNRELQIDLWDEAETGRPCPIPAEEFNFGALWETHDGLFTSSPDGRWLGYRYRNSLALYDRQTSHLVGCRGHASHFSRFERSKPLLIMLAVWYHDHGMQLMHAGLVARNGQGLLLPGKGGAGKSTASLACLLGGFEFLGDDFIGLEENGDGSFSGHSVFSSACLASGHLANFPRLAPHAVQNHVPVEDKATVFLAEIFRDQLRPTAPIRALVLPRIVQGTASDIRAARPAETLLRLAPSTLRYVVPRPGPEAMAMMARLVQRVPAFWLEMGSDISGIAGAVEKILHRAVSEAG